MNQVKSPLQAALLLACTMAAIPAAAVDHREHGAHVHGIGQMNVVLDGNTLAIELDSPAANLVGFEHAPRDEAEEAVLEQAVARLRDAAALFALPAAAQCQIEAIELKSALLEHEADEEHGHHHEEHEHGEEHAHHEAHADHDHDAAGHEHEAHEHNGEEGHHHADMEASYRFHCDKPGQLDGITVKLFQLFPATEELQVQLITPTSQGAAELTAESPRLKF